MLGPTLTSPTQGDAAWAYPVVTRWFGGWDKNNVFREGAGLLFPYLQNSEIGGCYALDFDETRPFYGPTDYAYSYYLGEPKRYLPAPWAERHAAAGDEGFVGEGRRTQGLVLRLRPNQRLAVHARRRSTARRGATRPSSGFPSFHGRHGGEGNVAWVDGHVESKRPDALRRLHDRRDRPALRQRRDPAARRRANVGDVDEDGDILTDELFELK